MRQIIAMGGGGFSMEPDNLALDRYILGQTHRPHPKVCFVPTASGDAESYRLRFYQAFSRLDCSLSCLTLFQLPTNDLESFVLGNDVIYVGGGNTRSMLALWKEWDLDRIFRKAYDAGVVLAGISAGANCWFEECTTDSVPGEWRVLAGLGYLSGSFSPHHDGEGERRLALHRFLQAGKILPGYAADNSAAVHFVDEDLVCAVSSRAGAQVYRVSKVEGRVVEEAMEMRDVQGTGDSSPT
jgi:dipeptidase E